MYLTKAEIAISSTGGAAGTGNFDSVLCPNGLLYAVEFIASTGTTALAADAALPTTATVTLRPRGSTCVTFLSGISCTTDNWMLYPRTPAHDSTAATTAWNSTTYVPVQFLSIDGVRVSIAGCSCADLNGTVNVYVQGG